MTRSLIPTTPKATAIAPVPQKQYPAPVPIIEARRQMVEIQRNTRAIAVGGQTFEIDPTQLIRMIKQITQTIGEYKRMDNAYGRYVIPSLRKARSDMVSDLENHFGIHWEIDATGASRFFT